MAYLLLILASVASASATLLLRCAGLAPDGQALLGFSEALWYKGVAVGVYGLGFLAYAQALKLVPANFAYPVMTGFTLLLTLTAGLLWLGEAISPRVGFGAVLLVAGIVLIGAR